MIITQKANLDLNDPGQTPRFNAVQDDRYSRNLELTLYSDGVSWPIPEDAAVLIRYSKPDGTGGEYDSLPDGSAAWAVEENVLTLALAPQVLTVPGMVSLSASLISGDQQITTFAVCLNVKTSVLGNVAESEDYVRVLTLGTVEALAMEDGPTASITGTVERPVLNLGIPVPERGVDYWTEEDRKEMLEQLTSKSKEITIETGEDGYWNIRDHWTGVSGIYAKRTNLIPVKTGEGFLYTGNGADSVPSAIWFDGAGNVLSYEQYAVANGVRAMIAPVNAEYVRFYSHSYDGLDAVVLELTWLPLGDDRQVVIESKENGYWSRSGSWKESTGGAKRTNPILVTAADRFRYVGYGRWSTVSVLWYDADGGIVAYGQYADEDNNAATSVTLIPPVGAVYVRFCSYSEYGADSAVLGVSFETEANQMERFKESNILYGKKYVACGDSFTAGDFTNAENPEEAWDDVRQCYKTYPWWIAERNQMVLVNEAVCGTTMYNDGSETAFSVTRYTKIPTDADYITLCFGLNETDAELGTLEDTTTDTVLGAWNVVLEYLITNMPYAKIGIVIPDSWCTEAMRDAIASVAVYWGIPYLDLKGDTRVPLMIGGRYIDAAVSAKAVALRNAAFQITDTDSHPNVKGHEFRASVIENFLRSL